MNPESLKAVPKRFITHPETLGIICWNLANKLTDNRWMLDEVRGADVTRSLSEQIGFDIYVGEKEIAPVYNDIHAGFFASKSTENGYRGNPVDIDAYRLSLSSSQSIDQTEVPQHVLDEIFKTKAEFADDDEEEEFETILDTVTYDNLDEFEMTREQSIMYEIGNHGEIDTYHLTYAYLIEDEYVHAIRGRSERYR